MISRPHSIVICLFLLAFTSTSAMAVYHPKLGRFMQRDPRGTSLAPMQSISSPSIPSSSNTFIPRDPIAQYGDGLSLYTPYQSSPLYFVDPSGMAAACCGLEIGPMLDDLMAKLKQDWDNSPVVDRRNACKTMRGIGANWDIIELAFPKGRFQKHGCGTRGGKRARNDCRNTVTIHGKCYELGAPHYIVWGMAHRLCHDAGFKDTASVRSRRKGGRSTVVTYGYTLEEAKGLVRIWKNIRHLGSLRSEAVAWTEAGWNYSTTAPTASTSKCIPCKHKYGDDPGLQSLQAYFGKVVWPKKGPRGKQIGTNAWNISATVKR